MWICLLIPFKMLSTLPWSILIWVWRISFVMFFENIPFESLKKNLGMSWLSYVWLINLLIFLSDAWFDIPFSTRYSFFTALTTFSLCKTPYEGYWWFFSILFLEYEDIRIEIDSLYFKVVMTLHTQIKINLFSI